MKHQREHWASRLGFIMAAIGSAVGLGTLWMFPYITGENGGGLFVLVYLGFTIVIGIPVFIGELVLGRWSQRGAVGTFDVLSHRSKNWRLVGWLAVLGTLLVMSYYQVVAGWGLNYILLSLNNFAQNSSPEQIGKIFSVLEHSGDITIFFMILFTLITAAMVYQGIQKGIERWSRIMTTGLLILLVGLLFFSMTLDGFPEAARFVFYPDPSRLTPSGVLTALGLSLFTLSLGQGIMITYGSYLRPEDDIPKTAVIVVASDVIISILAVLMIFPIVFTFGFEPSSGPGLIFKTLPVLFGRVPASLLISVAFFVLFVFTALTSAIAMLEVVVANFMDLYQWSRKRATLISTGLILFLGIPCALSGTSYLFPQWKEMYGMTYFDTMSTLVGTWILPTIALFTSIFAGWSVPREQIHGAFTQGTAVAKLFGTWRWFIRYLVPLAIILVMLQEAGLINVDRWFGL
jgi:neurotransmitter:Na+ symporter, NSS family